MTNQELVLFMNDLLFEERCSYDIKDLAASIGHDANIHESDASNLGDVLSLLIDGAIPFEVSILCRAKCSVCGLGTESSDSLNVLKLPASDLYDALKNIFLREDVILEEGGCRHCKRVADKDVRYTLSQLGQLLFLEYEKATAIQVSMMINAKDLRRYADMNYENYQLCGVLAMNDGKYSAFVRIGQNWVKYKTWPTTVEMFDPTPGTRTHEMQQQ